MTNGWNKKPFEHCIEKVTYTHKIQRKDFLDEGACPVVSQEENFINGYWDNEADLFKVTTPVVVFGDHTKVLKYIDFDFVLGADGVKVLKPRDFLVPKFFYYQLQSANLDSLGYARHYKLLRELEIAYPARPEQQRIVGILDEAFDGIATAKANSEKNLKNAREIFRSYLNSAFISLGAQWEQNKLAEICGFIRGPFGGSLKKEMFKDRGYAVYEQRHAIHNQFDSIRYYIDEEKFEEMKRFELKPGNIIMSCSGATLGRVAIAPENVKQGIINQALLKLTPTKRILGVFLIRWMQSNNFQGRLKTYSQGAAIPNIKSVKFLKEIVIPVPPLSEQNTMVTKLNMLSSETEKLAAIYQQKIVALGDLKKSLLQQAFCGEL